MYKEHLALLSRDKNPGADVAALRNNLREMIQMLAEEAEGGRQGSAVAPQAKPSAASKHACAAAPASWACASSGCRHVKLMPVVRPDASAAACMACASTVFSAIGFSQSTWAP